MVAFHFDAESMSKIAPRVRAHFRDYMSPASNHFKSNVDSHLREVGYEEDAQLGSCSRDPIGYDDGLNLYRRYFRFDSTDPTGTRLVPAKREAPSPNPFDPEDRLPGNGFLDFFHCGASVKLSMHLLEASAVVSFYLWSEAESNNCCDLSLFGTDENLMPRTVGVIPQSEHPFTYYTYGYVNVRLLESESYRREPVRDCVCPCASGVECQRRKYNYSARNGLDEKANGAIEVTICADGSYNIWGFGGTIAVDGDKHYDEFKTSSVRKSCT